jgi:ABC-type antimicrobial peptide transport system permease subunit
VAERRREIGVRSALGAEPGQILAMVLAEGFQLAAIGSTLGIVGAFTVMRFLRSLLFEMRPMDPATLAGVGVVLIVVTLLACSVPARRALRISPVTALRGD